MIKLRPQTIVPMLTPEQIAGVAGPAPHGNLTYRGGPLLTAVEVVPVFWGSGWPSLGTTVSHINRFFDYILASPLLDLLAEYSVPGQIIGRGRRRGSVVVTTSEPGQGSGKVDDSEIQQTLQNWIAKGTVPPPNRNTLYFVYLPPGVSSTFQGGTSCQRGGYCGYHYNIGTTIFYGVIPFVTCDGCPPASGQAELKLTKITSHELCEAITDPIFPQGWYDDTNGEIGDICNADVEQTASYTIQGMWSNNAQACVIRLPPPVGNLCYSSQLPQSDDFGNWSKQGDHSELGQIAVTTTTDGRLEVFALDTGAGAAWTIFQTNPNMDDFDSGWISLGNPSVGLGQIAVGKKGVAPNERIFVFGLDRNDGLAWYTSQPDSTSGFGGNWSRLGDNVALGQITAGANANGQLEAFAVQRGIPVISIDGPTQVIIESTGEPERDFIIYQNYTVVTRGYPMDLASVTWTGGPGVSFTDAHAQSTGAGFDVPDIGTFTFQLMVTASDSLGVNASAQLTVVVDNSSGTT